MPRRIGKRQVVPEGHRRRRRVGRQGEELDVLAFLQIAREHANPEPGNTIGADGERSADKRAGPQERPAGLVEHERSVIGADDDMAAPG